VADQLVDGARTDGVELGIGGKVTRQWSVNGGYANQDARLTATASATALNGAVVQNVPRQSLALWNRYDFTPSWGAGLGVIKRGPSFTSTSNAVAMPGYTRVDAALYYAITQNYSVQLNVENLGDRKYYAYANGDNNITPGSPRAIRATLRASF
jgi:catecholate siderophore receptor